MRDYLTLGGRWVCAGWFWAFVLLALPNCALNSEGVACPPDNISPCLPDPHPAPPPTEIFEQGLNPTNAIMCDIPAPLPDGDDGCAMQAEADDPANVWLTQAATALADDQHSSIALDWSDPAACSNGRPKKITFLGGGPFPDGTTVCINCGTQIQAAVYPSAEKACVAKCTDLINFGNGPIPAEGAAAYCEANAHVSTNYNNKEMCDPRFEFGCTGGGNGLIIIDPRRTPEPVMWIDPIGTANGGTNTLIRTAATSVPADFDAGAASKQLIMNGDAWVEFSAGETGVSHVLSLRSSCDDPLNDCPDDDPGIDAIGFAISLNSDGLVYVLESEPGPLNVLGPYSPMYGVGERFRVRVRDNHDGTATISYIRFYADILAGVAVGCTPGSPGCIEHKFHTHDATISPNPSYPLRVDTSFREQNAMLTNVTLVRIIPQP